MQTIQFHFEDVTGPTPDSRRFGLSHLSFDGEGQYTHSAIELFSQLRNGASHVLLPGSAKFAEVVRVLEAERAGDIAIAINTALERGAYMALHGRNMPRGALPADMPHRVAA